MEFINTKLGINLDKKEISEILASLNFNPKWTNNNLEVSVPSWRAQDIDIQEDIVEEVARLYGYHNLPSQLMTGLLPEQLPDAPFDFETKVKQIIKGLGGVEIYTLSLTSRDLAGDGQPLKLKNPLGKDSEYLRIELRPSLVDAVKQNKAISEPFHLFEMSNVYLPVKGDLPREVMKIAGIFSHYDYRVAKGIVESLVSQLNVEMDFELQQIDGFIYYEFDSETMRSEMKPRTFVPIPKYPAQIEDISIVLSNVVIIGDIVNHIKKVDKRVVSVDLTDIYEDTKTFRITYQNPNKTLTNAEVTKIRSKIIKTLENKFGARIK